MNHWVNERMRDDEPTDPRGDPGHLRLKLPGPAPAPAWNLRTSASFPFHVSLLTSS